MADGDEADSINHNSGRSIALGAGVVAQTSQFLVNPKLGSGTGRVSDDRQHGGYQAGIMSCWTFVRNAPSLSNCALLDPFSSNASGLSKVDILELEQASLRSLVRLN